MYLECDQRFLKTATVCQNRFDHSSDREWSFFGQNQLQGWLYDQSSELLCFWFFKWQFQAWRLFCQNCWQQPNHKAMWHQKRRLGIGCAEVGWHQNVNSCWILWGEYIFSLLPCMPIQPIQLLQSTQQLVVHWSALCASVLLPTAYSMHVQCTCYINRVQRLHCSFLFPRLLEQTSTLYVAITRGISRILGKGCFLS